MNWLKSELQSLFSGSEKSGIVYVREISFSKYCKQRFVVDTELELGHPEEEVLTPVHGPLCCQGLTLDRCIAALDIAVEPTTTEDCLPPLFAATWFHLLLYAPAMFLCKPEP